MAFTCAACTTNEVTGVKTCTYTEKTWKLFYANCPRSNINCSSTSSGYVPVITVCLQSL